MLVNGEGDTEHFSRKHYSRCGFAQTFGKLRFVIRPPWIPLRSGSCAVKEQTPIFSGAAFAQSATALFQARVIGARIEASGCDHGIAR